MIPNPRHLHKRRRQPLDHGHFILAERQQGQEILNLPVGIGRRDPAEFQFRHIRARRLACRDRRTRKRVEPAHIARQLIERCGGHEHELKVRCAVRTLLRLDQKIGHAFAPEDADRRWHGLTALAGQGRPQLCQPDTFGQMGRRHPGGDKHPISADPPAACVGYKIVQFKIGHCVAHGDPSLNAAVH